ncbi:MAG: sodium:solute symporter family protein [Bacteroidales bacterium]|nr:sodium:solute symporter family protein [Bacteroidales bacterium]
MLTPLHIIGILLTIGLILAASFLSGRKVKDAQSFTTGGKSGSWMVCGALMGTLMGGQCTVGTAQLAFNFGLSAWWFTIGAALGAVVLALFYAAPIRRSGCSTLLEIVARQYGHKAETVGSLLFLIGIFISIVAQVITSSAMLGSLFHLPMFWAALIGAVLIMLLVLFGGIKSAGAAGIIKLVLLYISSLAAGVVVWRMAGGFAGVGRGIDAVYALPGIAEENGIADLESIHHRYGSLFGRGVAKNLGGCLSIILGVVSTQTYAQSIWSAATTPKARRGALYCAFLIPLIGAACTLVGMYMRGHYVTAAELAALQAAGERLPDGIGVIENSAQTFPAFILKHMPAWIGGIMLGTLLINILGCASGLSLGAATILVRDVVQNLINLRKQSSKSSPTPQLSILNSQFSVLTQTRLAIVVILLMAAGAANLFRGSFINDLGFLSLGLRAVALLFPLSFALWLPGRFRPRAILVSMAAGTAAMLLAKVLTLPADPVYYGLALSLLVILLGSRRKGQSPV